MAEDSSHYEALLRRKDREIDQLKKENKLLFAVALRRANAAEELMERMKKLGTGTRKK